MKKKILLVEADRKVFMTKKEQELKKRLIALLKDDGKGHHHAKYAARLADFDINIVPLKRDPMFTAAISFEDGIIYIGEGFLNDPSTFYQLNVLLRHELAHNLLMHEIRMMHKIGEHSYSHIKYSQSLHDLLNIIMDFEISNKKYSAEDKIIVKNMWLNGKLIGGLVTEDHRKNWEQMTVEEMYDEMSSEIDVLKRELLDLANNRKYYSGVINDKDFMQNHERGAFIYTDTKSPCQLRMPLEDFVKSTTFKRYPDVIQEVIMAIFETIVLDPNVAYSEQDIRDYMQQIAESAPAEEVDLSRVDTGEIFTTLYTPEEKLLSMEVLKNIIMYANQYQEWYEKVMGVLDDKKYTNDNIKDILAALNN